MTKVMLATPCYNGKVNVPYAVSLAETTFLLMKNNIPLMYNLTSSGSLLVAERNRILQMFMESDCTHLLCIDSDLGWQPHAVTSLLLKNKEFVAGVYPARELDNFSFTFRPVLKEDGAIEGEDGLLKMEYIPAGFMLISRSALVKMQEKFPELYYEPKHESMKHAKGWCFFNTEVWGGEFWGEDYFFCRKAREAGVDIWVDPTIVFNHDGKVGMLLSALSDKPKEGETKIAEAPATA
jgi:hypothetical protein